jgi:hypothetical protein
MSEEQNPTRVIGEQPDPPEAVTENVDPDRQGLTDPELNARRAMEGEEPVESNPVPKR